MSGRNSCRNRDAWSFRHGAWTTCRLPPPIEPPDRRARMRRMETVGDLLARRVDGSSASELERPDPRRAAVRARPPGPARARVAASDSSTSRAAAPRCSPGPGCCATARSTACASSPPPRTSASRTPGARRASSTGTARITSGPCGLQAHDFELLGLRRPRPALDRRARPGRVTARALRARRARRADRSPPTSPPFADRGRALVVPDRAAAVVRAPRRGRATRLRRRPVPAPSGPRRDGDQAVAWHRARS